MKRTLIAAAAALLAVALLATTTGCTRVRLQDEPSTKTTTESGTVQLQGATKLDAVVRQGVGDFTLRSSATTTEAVETVFTYAPASWKPEVTSSVEGTTASMRISQPTTKSMLFGDMRNSWLVTLPAGVPTDLSLTLGVGTSDVDLRGVDLTNLNVTTGVGSTTLDLSGTRTADLGARIESGVGNLTLRVPRSMGVRVTGRQDGVGDVSADGFTIQGDAWVNAAYAGSGPKIEIDLTRGVGDVTLVLVD